MAVRALLIASLVFTTPSLGETPEARDAIDLATQDARNVRFLKSAAPNSCQATASAPCVSCSASCLPGSEARCEGGTPSGDRKTCAVSPTCKCVPDSKKSG